MAGHARLKDMSSPQLGREKSFQSCSMFGIDRTLGTARALATEVLRTILNEIEADKSGTITQILAENGQAVEYGAPLFVIE